MLSFVYFSSIMAEPRTNHETALLEAVKGGFIDKVQELLDLNLVNLNDERYLDYHLIMKALDSHHVELAKLLIEKGFRVHKESKSSRERTVLHAATAVQSRVNDLIRILLAKGASSDILIYDEQNMTPFHIAVDNYRLHTINLFMCHYDTESLDEQNFLHYAILKGKSIVVSQLVKKGLSLKKRDKENLTPFWVAIKNAKFEILNILLSNCSIKDINANNSDDLAPLFMATICGDLEFIRNYANFGLPINTPLKLSKETWPSLNEFSGFTVMHFAVKHVRLEVVELLLSLGADILIKNDDGSTPLHIAFETREKGIWESWKDNNLIIDMILEANTKLNSNPINNHGLSHFHVACSRDNTTVVEHFLKVGTSIDQQINSKYFLYENFSPLYFATKFECLNTVEFLLKNGANFKLTDSKKMTALHIAVEECFVDVVSLLLQYDADITCKDALGSTPLHWAFKNRDYETADLLLSAPNAANSNPRNSEGISHFHIASAQNNANVVKSFIENGVDLDSCIPVHSKEDNNSVVADWIGYSPLHFAVSRNRAKIVQLLLDNGANVNVCVPENRDKDGCFSDYSGYSPLHFAVSNNRAKIILLLRKRGANINLKNSHGETSVDLAYLDTLGLSKAYGCLDDTQCDRITVFHTIVLGSLPWCEVNLAVPTLTNVGFNINSQDSKGLTALHLACKNKYYNTLEILLMNGADINIEDNKGRSICCYLYEEYLKNFPTGRLCSDVQQMMNILQMQIIKMTVIGLPVTKKVFLSNSKFDRFQPLTDHKKVKLISQCQNEVQILKDTKIHKNCSLYNVIFKDENALAHIINNPVFEDIVFSESFDTKYPMYSYLINLKHQAGVDRADLLPAAKDILNDLARLHLPDICSENICKYFTNAELKVSIEILRGILDLKKEISDNTTLIECKTVKRQRLN